MSEVNTNRENNTNDDNSLFYSASYSEDSRFLNKSLLSNELVVFVGAGASVGSKFPSWETLLDEIQSRLGLSKKSFSDNTILPQLYYNARGKKDYTELIHDLLYKPNAKPNEIHRCLAKMNPRYIITTNYDNLIEQAFSDSGIYLDVIEKDSDLPYAHSDHMLIKMHGGFRYNNFVLKEDDYLNYSRNFTLIENYIKALFARYTVLFVGYSFNDPDTKQLLAWVKHILKEDQQRAYLINISDEYDPQTYEYYKNNGINVIFGKLMFGQIEDYTKRTEAILRSVFFPKYSMLAEINNIFKGYDSFNYISVNYIHSVFNKFFQVSFGDECLTCYCQTDLEYHDVLSYFDDTEKDTNNKLQLEYPYIIKILRKSSIKKIVFVTSQESVLFHNRQTFIISDHTNQDNILPFEEFDYAYVKTSIIQSFSDSEDQYLQEAYCYYFLKEYLACYKLLRKAASYYLSTNQLERYFITESNRINVGKILSYNIFIPVSPDQRERIKKEVELIENQGLYANSYLSIKNNTPLCELIDFSYIYHRLYSIIKKGRKVDEESRTLYSLHTGKSGYEELEDLVQDLYNYMQYNYLFLDIYSETRCIYTTFIDYILLSLSTKEEKTDGILLEINYNIVLNQLSKFDILVILRFLTYKEIKSLTSKYNIDRVPVKEDVFSYLSNVINNLNCAFQQNLVHREDVNIYNKLFHILKMIELPETIHTLLYQTVKILICSENNSLEYSEINSFITMQFRERKWSFDEDELESLIMTMCTTISRNNHIIDSIKYLQILKNFLAIFHQIFPDKIMNFSDQNKSLFLISLSKDTLISLYSVVDDDFQQRIRERIRGELLQQFDDAIYFKALARDIITAEKQYEDMLYDFVKGRLVNDNNDSNEIIYHADNNYLSYCALLLFENKLIEKERFLPLIKHEESLSLLIDPNNYDYSNFKPQLLQSLTSKSLQILSNNAEAYNHIHIALKEYLSENLDDEIAKIYINYFS